MKGKVRLSRCWKYLSRKERKNSESAAGGRKRRSGLLMTFALAYFDVSRSKHANLASAHEKVAWRSLKYCLTSPTLEANATPYNAAASDFEARCTSSACCISNNWHCLLKLMLTRSLLWTLTTGNNNDSQRHDNTDQENGVFVFQLLADRLDEWLKGVVSIFHVGVFTHVAPRANCLRLPTYESREVGHVCFCKLSALRL